MLPADRDSSTSTFDRGRGSEAAISDSVTPVSVRPAGRVRTGRAVAAAPSLVEIFGASGLAQIALIAAGLAWVYWDQLVRMVHYWTNNPDWSHGFLIPLFSVYFL